MKPEFHAPGVYFGMPAAEYHADPSLSNSGLQNLRVSPLTYWANSPLNPDFEPEETKATETGTAFHKRILEGEEVFHAAYAPKLVRSDHPDALKSGDKLKAHCDLLGLKKSGTLAELSARIREQDRNVQLWAEIEADYERVHAGKEFIGADTIRQIELAAAAIESNPETASLLTGGFPEVSIFWIDEATGVRMKARLDYLTPQTITDLKTFSNSQGKPLMLAVSHAIANHGYLLQSVIYLEAVDQLKRMLEAGKCAMDIGPSLLDAAFDFDKWLASLRYEKAHRFVFLFQESGRVPNVAILEASRNSNYYDITRIQYEYFVRRYQECVERWGFDKPWIDPAEVAMLEDEDLPLWLFKE